MVDTYLDEEGGGGGGGGSVGALHPGPEQRDEHGISMLVELLMGTVLILPLIKLLLSEIQVLPGLGQEEELFLLLQVLALLPLGTLHELLLLLPLQLVPERYCKCCWLSIHRLCAMICCCFMVRTTATASLRAAA